MKTNKTFSAKLLNSWGKLVPGLVTGASEDVEKVTDTDIEKKSNELQTIISKIK